MQSLSFGKTICAMSSSSYTKVSQPKLSDVIARRIETMILEGVLKPGERLLPERELAAQFNVSRPSLREAIQKLEAKGLLHRRQGGGNFVNAELDSSFVEPLFGLLTSHAEVGYDLLEFRHALEGISAYYAALRGTEADRARIRRCYDALMDVHAVKDSAREAAADAEFHLAIAEAAHNVVLLHVMRGLFRLLQSSIVHSLEKLYTKETVRQTIPRQHRSLLEAIDSGDANGARDAAHEHLAFVEETLLEMSRERSRVERSLRRMRGEEGR